MNFKNLKFLGVEVRKTLSSQISGGSQSILSATKELILALVRIYACPPGLLFMFDRAQVFALCREWRKAQTRMVRNVCPISQCHGQCSLLS